MSVSKKMKMRRKDREWVRDTIIKYVLGHGRHPLGGTFEHLNKEELCHNNV